MVKDIILFLKNLSFIDYVFFFTVIFLIILVVSLIYFIRINEDEIEQEKVTDPDNLQDIANALKNTETPKPVTFTSYEKEQEDRAIISYDELLSNTGEYALNYSSEDNKDGLTVKKFDLDNLVNPSLKVEPSKIDVHLFSTKREEEFLKILKELQKSLN